MVMLDAYFDGKQIIVPEALRGHPPTSIKLLVDGAGADTAGLTPGTGTWNAMDIILAPRAGRPVEQLDQDLRDARKGWDEP